MPAETVSCAVIPTAYLCFHGGALRRFNMPLIVTREVHRGTTLEGQFCHPADLSAVIHAPGIFPERRFLSIAQQIRAANVVEVPHFATAQAGEVAFRPIRASLAVAVSFGVIDAAHFIL